MSQVAEINMTHMSKSPRDSDSVTDVKGGVVEHEYPLTHEHTVTFNHHDPDWTG